MVCQKCGTLLGPTVEPEVSRNGYSDGKVTCKLCNDGEGVSEVDIPYIFRYLVTELAACNINVKLTFEKK